MKRFLFLSLMVLASIQIHAIEKVYSEKTIVVLVASYNNKDWYEKNLTSIFSQKYFNFHVLYIDDVSTDGTADLVQEWTEKHGVQDRITIIRNTERFGGLANHYRAIQLIPDRAIVCVVDGDDWLAHANVFDFLNQEYTNKDIWMSYGQFAASANGMHGWCCEIPDSYVNRNAYREFPHNLSHLRTFYAGLFKQIKKEDLMNEGEFWSINDNATMFPMAEMARGHVKFNSQILYIWNNENPINDHQAAALGKRKQLNTDQQIRGLPRYGKVSSPFTDDLKGTLEELQVNVEKARQERTI